MAKKPKISDGPFHVGMQTLHLGYVEIGDKHARRIAMVDSRDYTGRMEELFANANLFAASWGMLDVLKGTLKVLKAEYPQEGACIQVIDEIIKQAEKKPDEK